jgi:hypothetical protein
MENVGETIKTWAQVLLVVGIFSSIISGIAVFSINSYWIETGTKVLFGFLIMIVGSLLSWVSSMVLYAYGELTDSTMALRQRIDEFAPANLNQQKELIAILSKLYPVSNDISEVETDTKKVPDEAPGLKKEIKIERNQSEISCPNCGTKQASNRSVCYHYGAQFIDTEKKDIFANWNRGV